MALVVLIWRRAPNTTTVIAALIGALAVVFKDTLTNLVAGLIFAWSGSFRPGDVIRLDPSLAKSLPEPYGHITALTMLHVLVQERDGMQILIPNSQLSSTTVWRWSGDRDLALSLRIHIAPSSNLKKATDLIVEAAASCERVLKSPLPRARLAGLKDGNIIIDLRFWIVDPQNGIRNVYSDILERTLIKMEESAIELRETSY
jgi:small-conductance mechanosensitive channel